MSMRNVFGKMSVRSLRDFSREQQSKPVDLTKITKEDSGKERRHKLRHSFNRNGVIMKVTEENICMDQEGEPDDADLYEGELILPRSSSSGEEGEQQQQQQQLPSNVPNCCIICLDSYCPGDDVVWSSNPECQHAFHRRCIVKYLVKIQKKVAGTPCPCCRAQFTDLKVEVKRRKYRRRRRVSTGLEFQLSSLSIGSIFNNTSFRLRSNYNNNDNSDNNTVA